MAFKLLKQKIDDVEEDVSVEQLVEPGKFKLLSRPVETVEEGGEFAKTSKEIAKRGATGLTEGFLGTYGDILDTLGLQSPDVLQPGQKELLKAQHEAPESIQPFLDMDDDLMPRYGKLPSSEDIKKFLGMLGINIKPSKEFLGRAAERAGKGLGAALSFGGAGAGAMATGGAVGQAVEEGTESQLAGSLAELATSLRADKILTKKLLPGAKTKDIVEAGRKLGLTEQQLTPLIQKEGKLAFLGKFARKGDKQEKLIAGIESTLGDAYEFVKTDAKKLPAIPKEDSAKLADSFDNIVENLKKTVKPNPEKQQAIDFISVASDIVRKEGTTPESLINFYQDVNHIVNWRKAGQKSAAALKGPIVKALNKADPKLAKEFENLNTLYSKFKTASKHLKPKEIDKYLNMGKIGGLALSLATGHPAGVKAAIGAGVTMEAATQALTNPRFQNMSRKLLKAITDDKTKSALALSRQMVEFIKEKPTQ